MLSNFSFDFLLFSGPVCNKVIHLKIRKQYKEKVTSVGKDMET